MAAPAHPPRRARADAELVDALRRGDARAYERLVRDHAGAMLAVATRILGGGVDAEDVVQLAFVSAFRSIGRFEGDAAITTWLHRITVNAALMRLRSQRRRPEQPIDALLPRFAEDGHHAASVDPLPPDAETALIEDERRRAVRARIDALPAAHREVLILRDLEELDTAETARILGVSPGAVKTRLHRARQALLTALTEAPEALEG